MSETNPLFTSEDLPEAVQTSDYKKARTPIAPGKYISPYREFKVTRKEDGHITFEVNFTGGWFEMSNGHGEPRSFKYVPRTYLSTKRFKPKGASGETSSVAQYLEVMGFSKEQLSALTSKSAVESAVLGTANVPVGVRSGLEDDPQERPKVYDPARGKEVPIKARAYTKDFKREDGSFATTIEKDGVTLVARERVEGFFKLA